MEHITCELSDEKFDKAVHGGLDKHTVLPCGQDLAVYIKRNATEQGNPAAVFTFTVQLPDGTIARAQCVTTVRLLETIGGCIRGWKDGGHL